MNRKTLKSKCMKLLAFVFIVTILAGCSSAEKKSLDKLNYISFLKKKNNFPIAENGMVTPIVADPSDFPGVFRVLNYFKNDVKSVTTIEPKIILGEIPQNKYVIIVGTLGKSKLIDQLVANNKIDVSDLTGKWETSLIEVINNPMDGVEKALVIAGSDKRGTFFGILDVSRKMGVSPWYWWADVPSIKHEDIYVKSGRYNLGEPKVKYRGIFLNDEEPALGRWAVENYGGFNHQFYEKVFELMLRLKGNYIWPAMWWASFNADDPLNTALADEMGIVMGTSHHEPMDRAHAEWKAKKDKGPWNYESNTKELREFWKEGIERIGNREVIVNMAMRGDGDMAMSAETNIELLEKIVKDQREIIEEVTGNDASETPQMWALYKEVQSYYDHGMRVPDDITLLLCDDNWGNIRKLPKPGTPSRKGGYGIYYHFDYVGGPRNYKWLNTSPIPRIWEQMNLAYEHGVDRLWLVNVGDLKPMEYPISFWLDYAWNPELIQAEDLNTYAKNWAAEQFGKKYAKEIASLMKAYTKYNGRRKPELLEPSTYSLGNFNEADSYVEEYYKLEEKAIDLSKKLPTQYSDAFYQLVLHPIKACANLNDLYVSVAKNRLYAKQGRASANDYARKVEQLFAKDDEITKYYHTELSNGKWNNMMNQVHIGYTYWQQPDKAKMPNIETIDLPNIAEMGIAVSGTKKVTSNEVSEIQLPDFSPYNNQPSYIDVFNKGAKSFKFKVESNEKWMNVIPSNGRIEKETRLNVTVDWKKVPEGKHNVILKISGPDKKYQLVKAIVVKPTAKEAEEIKGFVESNGYISIEAEHFSNNKKGENATWKSIPGLGRTLSAMHPVPVNAIAQKLGKGCPVLEYNIHLTSVGELGFKAYLSTTLNIYNDEGLEFAVSIDDQEPQILNIHEDFSFGDWEDAVRNNVIFANAKLNVKNAGNHTLKIWMVDPGIVLQKIVLETSEPKYSYLGPPESVCIH